jgi:hypothetical protein
LRSLAVTHQNHHLHSWFHLSFGHFVRLPSNIEHTNDVERGDFYWTL